MSRLIPGLRILGVYVGLVGMLAFAGSAQAEVGANWMINGANITSTLESPIQVNALENNTASLLTKISGAEVEFLCTGVQLIGVNLRLNGGLTGGRARFTGCLTRLNKSLSSPCKPKAGGQPLGTIETQNIKGLLVLHNGVGVIRIEPEVGETFANMEFDPEAECSLPEVVPVRGKLFLDDCQGELKVEKVSHLFDEGPLTHLWVISLTAEHKAVIDGSATVGISGTDEGLKWSGLPA